MAKKNGPKAQLVIRETVVYENGAIADVVVWQVPTPVPPTTHGFKYRLVYILEGTRAIGYDNERGKGDHRHEGAIETPYIFRSIDALLEDFASDVERLRGGA